MYLLHVDGDCRMGGLEVLASCKTFQKKKQFEEPSEDFSCKAQSSAEDITSLSKEIAVSIWKKAISSLVKRW